MNLFVQHKREVSMNKVDVKPTMWELRRNQPRALTSTDQWTDVNDRINWDGLNFQICTLSFECLAETAGPILRHHHGDLFHDAMQLQNLVSKWDHKDELVFYWGCRESGTQLLKDFDQAFEDYCEVFFKCRVFPEDRRWGTVFTFDMTRMK